MIRRREFITLLGGAAAWPLAAHAQQGDRIRRIGVLLPANPDDTEYQARVGAFLQGLQQGDWSIGRNVRIDTRWAGVDADAIRQHGAELAALAPDVILANGASAVGPLLQATRTVPIVFPVVTDPVAAGCRPRKSPRSRARMMPRRRQSGTGPGLDCYATAAS
jgi:putative tryptophan/tyrosine transport system substrate-binding protein